MNITFYKLFLFNVNLIFLLFFSCSITEITISSKKIPITIQSDENGYVCGAGTSQVSEGDSMVISVCHAAEHYNFKEWVFTSGDSNCILWNKFDDTTVIKNIIGPVSLKATFALNTYTLTVTNPSNGGTITVNPSKALYQHGETVTFELINPPIGYRLGAWTGGASGNANPTTITMTGATTLSATLEIIPGVTGVVYVRKGATGLNSGSSWANAYTDLETAFTAGGADKTYWVAEGEYRTSDSSNVNAYFTIPNGAKLYGGFSGFETLLDKRVWYDHPSIIHGGSGGTGGNPQNYLFRMEGSNNRVNGFLFERTIIACILVRSAANMDTIENCVLRNNVTDAAVAFKAINIAGTNTVVANCVFYNNGPSIGATSDGHAIHIVETGTGTKIVNCLLVGNRGPAISNGTSNNAVKTQIYNCTIVNNATATGEQVPGGISVVRNAITVRGCILWGNTTSRTNGTQIDSAAEITFSCIQGGIPGGILSQPAGATYELNTYNNPVFTRTAIPTNFADFYSSSDAVVPFLPTSADIINKATFTRAAGRPDYDLRSRGRSFPNFDIGAYETP